jgi:hypothetical protein
MEGAEQQKRRLTLGTRTPRSFAIWWISQAGGFANGQPPLHFLTVFNRTDSFVLGKELVGENRGVDRILRRLKLHAEGRQFGDQNS